MHARICILLEAPVRQAPQRGTKYFLARAEYIKKEKAYRKREKRGQLIRYKKLLRIPHDFEFLFARKKIQKKKKKDEKDAFPTGLYQQKTHLPLYSTKKYRKVTGILLKIGVHNEGEKKKNPTIIQSRIMSI